jgi:hypothetical protein
MGPQSVSCVFRSHLPVYTQASAPAQIVVPERVSVSLPDCRLRLLQSHKQSGSGPSEKLVSLGLRAAPFAPGRPNRSGQERKTKTCFAKIASLSSVFLARTPRPHHTEWHSLYSLLARYQRELERERQHEYKTRTEWHRVICWNKLADWAGNLQKGAYVEVEGELRYREYTPADSIAACA